MKKIIISIILIFVSSSNLSQDLIPEWAKGIVWYQIFPERFCNGDSDNDPEAFKIFAREDSIIINWQVTRWTSNWFDQDDWEKKLGGNIRDHLYQRRYGGDIQGIINKLDYLKELGIGALYLNPVFEAASLHKYDGSTFHHIDVNFGPDPDGDRKLILSETPNDPETWVWTSADKLFLELISEVHKRGMRIIIDGVFNHTGVEFWAFKDIVNKGEDSEFKDWYKIKSFDDLSTQQNEFDYEGWWNVKSLPEFNRTADDLHPGPKQYIYYVTERWMDPDADGNPSDGIDGWRLDVVRDVPAGFWKYWSRLVKTLNHSAIIVGELWELSPDYITESGPFDALMNYNFAYSVKKLFIDQINQITVSSFIKMIQEIKKAYPEENLLILQNLMTSHDTERLSSLIKNPDRAYDRDANERNPDYDPSKPSAENLETQKLIVAFQMTYNGAPMIFYGDEVGMWGADDPHCRKPMIWVDLEYDDEIINTGLGFNKGFGQYIVKPNEDLLNFYKKLIKIRNDNIELTKGKTSFTYSDDFSKSFAFERIFLDKKMIIVFNLGEESTQLVLPYDIQKFKLFNVIDELPGIIENCGNQSSQFKIRMLPRSFAIYKLHEIERK